MRVIAGTSRGIRLKQVPGKHVRPTTDRVKESLFQVLGPYFDGGWALDLFAGSGALGIEAVSRGMDHAVFVDQSKASIQVVKVNVDAANIGDRSEIYCVDARHALKVLQKRGIQFQLIFLDPPYHLGYYEPMLELISSLNLVLPTGQVVAEYAKQTVLPDKVHDLTAHRHLDYGNTRISLYCYRER